MEYSFVKWSLLSAIVFTIQVILFCPIVADAFIPSPGHRTNDEVRQMLNDSQFKIDTLSLPPIKVNGYLAFVANAKNTPVLTGNDVQAMVAILRMKSGSFTRHLHPRGFEVFTVLRGTVQTTLELESPRLSPRIVKLTLKYGQSTVFPIGLIHSLKCISKKKPGCIAHEVFNSADAGTISV